LRYASKWFLPKQATSPVDNISTPRPILLSIGGYKYKEEFLDSVKILQSLGFELYGTEGTADYYNSKGITIKELVKYNSLDNNLFDNVNNKGCEMIINISRKKRLRTINNYNTLGYKLRRTATDSSIPIITDIKQAKMFVKSINHYLNNVDKLRVRTDIDCFTSYKTITLPGLIDIHVHVREPGNTEKEDWTSCTKSALAGGITTIFAMPNTNPPITDIKSFGLVKKLANDKACCDYGLFLGASNNNYNTIHQLAEDSVGLKMYLNNTYGPLLLDNTLYWMEHIKNWIHGRPICVHAESKTLPAILHIANLYKKHIHVCHVARREEIEIIKQSKIMGQHVTCEVAPHHLFLTIKDKMKICNCYHVDDLHKVKPPLMTSDDQQALWDNMDYIDCFATDHAPHTLSDKQKYSSPGYAGLETALPLLLTAIKQGRLTINDIIEKYHTNPMKIFNIPKQEHTFIEVDMDKQWIIPDKTKYTKCNWTPFSGMKVTGMVKRVVLRGKTVFIDGQVIAKAGTGKNIRLNSILDNNTFKKTITITEDDNIPKSIPIRSDLNLDNVLSVSQFNRIMLRQLFDKATDMKLLIKKYGSIDLLKNKIMTTLFYEPSTRTKSSFTVAMKKLGGQVIDISSNTSSIKKGETIEDSVRSLECYSDVIVIRTSQIGSIKKASE
jgi:carbamoyl-phosphate synthase/aspartate carbamoyltransferase/dihydroorotase